MNRYHFALFLLAGLAACTKKHEDAPAAASSAPTGIAPVDDVAAFLANDDAPLTAEMEERLVLGLKGCPLKDESYDLDCDAAKALSKARNKKTTLKNLVGMSAGIGKKHLDDADPAIRFESVRMMGSLFGADDGTQKALLDRAKIEAHPAVLRNIARVVGSRHKGNSEVKALLFRLADHPSEAVRSEALGWFVTSFSQGESDTFDKVLEKLEKDPSMAVRTKLCSSLSRSGDSRAVPTIKKYLDAKTTDDKLYGACFGGLVGAWAGFPKADPPSKEAYEATLKHLTMKPRTHERPPWNQISSIRSAKLEVKNGFDQKWVDAVKPWFKPEATYAALSDLAGDSNANWIGRSAAVDAMVEMGAPKAVFAALQKKLAGKTGEDALVLKTVEKALSGAK